VRERERECERGVRREESYEGRECGCVRGGELYKGQNTDEERERERETEKRSASRTNFIFTEGFDAVHRFVFPHPSEVTVLCFILQTE
jgi:hypothetical protein